MQTYPSIILIDDSRERRDEFLSHLRWRGLHPRSFEGVSQFIQNRPPKGLVLVHDQDGLLSPLWKALAQEQDSYPHVVYSQDPQWQRAVSAFSHGARTYLAFPDQVDEIPLILETLHDVLLKEEESATQREKAREKINSLTSREIDILGGIIAGMRSRLIAETFGISVRTVDTHRSRILKKMDAGNGADLVRIASQADLFARNGPNASGFPVDRCNPGLSKLKRDLASR